MMLELRTNIFWIVADVTAYYVKCKFFGEMILNIHLTFALYEKIYLVAVMSVVWRVAANLSG